MILLLALVASLQGSAADSFIEQLKSDTPEVRESASKKLRTLGAQAEPALETAAKAIDSEVAQRARELLKQINSDRAQVEFARLRDKMEKAKTLKVCFEGLWDAADGEERLRKGFRGHWAIGSGGKAQGVCWIKTSVDEPHHAYLAFLSDGTKTAGGYKFDSDKPIDTPPNFRNDLLQGLSTLGSIHSTIILLREPIDSKQPHLPCAQEHRYSDFQLLEDKGSTTRELIYTAHAKANEGKAGPPILKCHLWYDSDAGVPRKRTVTLFHHQTGVPESIISETYTEFSYDQEIPEENFKF